MTGNTATRYINVTDQVKLCVIVTNKKGYVKTSEVFCNYAKHLFENNCSGLAVSLRIFHLV